MALSYTLHSPTRLANGAKIPIPNADRAGGEYGLASGTDSATLVVGASGVELRLVADEDQRVDIAPTIGAAARATDTARSDNIKLKAGVPEWFLLCKGSYKLKWAAG